MNKTLRLLLATTISLSLFAEEADVDFTNEAQLAKQLGDYFKIDEADWVNFKRSGSTNPVTDVFYNIPLTNTKLSTVAAAGVELKQSGRYYIANNFTRGLAANASYILVSGTNVVLDMNACTIQGGLQTTSTTAKGIAVNNSITNVRIINGYITAIQGDGINIGTSCDTIGLEKIKISSYQDNGITFQTGTKNILLSGIEVTTSSSPTTTAYGLNLVGVTTGIIEDSSFNNSAASVATNNAAGVFISGCTDVTFRNCEANSNTGATSGGGYGFLMGTTASASLKFVNCTANNNTSATGQAVGFYSSVALTNSLFDGCDASANSTGAYASAAVAAAGYAFETTASTNNEFRNCTATGNTSSTITASAIVAGFAINIASSNNNRFNKCLASGNSITGASAASTCAGYYSTASNNLNFDGSKAIGNTNGSAAGITCGFRLTNGGVSNVINGCESNGQFSSFSTSGVAWTGRVVGIELGDSEKLTTVSGCSVVGNAFTGSPDTAPTGSIYGILLGTSTTGVSRCSVMRNTVRSTAITAYTTGATMTLAGLRDFTTDSNSLLAGNILALNGYSRLNIGSAPNFDIVAADLLASASTGGLNIYLTYDDGQNVADIVVETDVSNMQALSTGLEGWTNYLIVPQQVS